MWKTLLDIGIILWYNSIMRDELLNEQQLAFCDYYTTLGETYAHGLKSYAMAYNFDIPVRDDGKLDYKSSEYRTCQANASRLLLNPKVRERIQDILNSRLNDKNVDARLATIVENGKDSDSVQAIRIYNDLRNRITKRIDITSGSRPFADLSDDELAKLAE